MIDHPLAASAALSSVAAIVYSYLVKSYGESESVELSIEEDFIPWLLRIQPETIRRDFNSYACMLGGLPLCQNERCDGEFDVSICRRIRLNGNYSKSQILNIAMRLTGARSSY